jgi:hypothetical protein
MRSNSASFRTYPEEKVTDVTRPCFVRASDSIAMPMSVFLVISAIAISNALGRKFAQTGNGASWMIFPSHLAPIPVQALCAAAPAKCASFQTYRAFSPTRIGESNIGFAVRDWPFLGNILDFRLFQPPSRGRIRSNGDAAVFQLGWLPAKARINTMATDHC